jgi:uncharacterized ubiquitin-like protein YukD
MSCLEGLWVALLEEIRSLFVSCFILQYFLHQIDLGLSTQRQARKLISGISSTAKTRFLSLNRIQAKIVTGLLTGHKTLRRHLYLMELTSSTYVGSVEQKKKPQSTFCVSVKLWLHSDMHNWVSSSWTQRMLRVYVCGPSGKNSWWSTRCESLY